MSYVPGNETGDLPLIAGVVVASLVATTLWMRLDQADAGKIIGHCADGTVIGLWKDGVRRRLGRRPEERARIREAYPDPSVARQIAMEDLQPGALSFAALRAGQEGEAEWIIEALDSERESLAIVWEFEDEAEARGVLGRLEERIVRSPCDTGGEPIPVTSVDLDAVRARERAAWAAESPSSSS